MRKEEVKDKGSEEQGGDISGKKNWRMRRKDEGWRRARRYGELRREDRFRDMRTGENGGAERSINRGRDDEVLEIYERGRLAEMNEAEGRGGAIERGCYKLHHCGFEIL